MKADRQNKTEAASLLLSDIIYIVLCCRTVTKGQSNLAKATLSVSMTQQVLVVPPESLPPPPLTVGYLDPHLIQCALDRWESPPHTGRRSVQPFLRSAGAWQTDWHAPRYGIIGRNRLHLMHLMQLNNAMPTCYSSGVPFRWRRRRTAVSEVS